jgi:hypothetical protein
VIEGDDRKLFEESLRHATRQHTGIALDAALERLGWPDALAVDAHTAVSLLFELQGAANVVSSALDQVLAHVLGHESATVVLPELGTWHAPGGGPGVRGLGSSHFRGCATALVVVPDGESHVAMEIETAALSQRPVEGIDPSFGLVEITGQLDGARRVGPMDWPAAVAVGRLALGHELVGASRRMLDLAREHALLRIQFGRPIAMFQAVRHRLADTLVAIEAAAATLEAAWLDGTPLTAAMAKATAGRCARVAANHCQQVLAGIGFTIEHPFHRYVRRILILEQLLGSTRTLTRELGEQIIDHRRLPAPLPL